MKTTKRKSARYCLTLITAVLFCSLSYAQTITSDQTVYTPGLEVTFTGSGFGANEKVSLQVLNSDNTRVENVAPWIVITDSNGSFQTTWTVPNESTAVIENLKVTANARASGLATELLLGN